MSRTYIVFVLLLSLISSSIFAQNKYNLPQFFNESVDLVKQPFNWDGTDFLTFGGIALGTFGLMQFDESVRNEMLKDQSHFYSFPTEAARIWGEAIPTVLLGAGFLIHGYSSDNLSNKQLGYEIFQSAFYTLSTTAALKTSFGRARPYTDHDAFYYEPFAFESRDYFSLPSGHTSLAFSLSTILSENSTNNWIKVLSYIPAFATAFSRVYQNKHWSSDVFLGAAVGYFIAKFLHNLHEQNEKYNPPVSPTQNISFSIPL
ncbi:MAG: phosphatase PAP2 family protein [Melioribacteraceae bacterium]|nr:phosphatase PAP2 family protein [Melioribacteraceae bacterium]MCF8355628.1 phosphatase PAP2 family protein [Melioribacteraceae bacterium]MCF8394672.1 phosphatase PAP2 family protein [Melioribacteraceae bacterium]MCF8417994.1 phosphatase PAP2 family protein [Melioribacteraceae bacterium]